MYLLFFMQHIESLPWDLHDSLIGTDQKGFFKWLIRDLHMI